MDPIENGNFPACHVSFQGCIIDQLGGGFKHFLFSPLFWEDFQFDEHIFQMGGPTTNQKTYPAPEI